MKQAMTLIDQIKRDREAGTQGKFSKTSDHEWRLDTEGENAYFVIEGDHGPFAVVAVEEAFGMDDHNRADMRRVCNIPDMEAALLVADELAERINEWVADSLTDENCRDWFGHVEPALAAWNAATKGDQTDD